VTSLVAVVAPRTGKIIKKWPPLWKRRTFATKWYISFRVHVKPNARNTLAR